MNTRPVVVQIITRAIVGGAQRTVLELCGGLNDAYDMHVVCGPEAGTEGSLLAEFRSISPTTVVDDLRRDLHPIRDVKTIRTIRATLDKISPALVHTHSSKAGIVGRCAARTSSAPVVHTVHGWGHTPDDAVPRRMLYVALERTAARWTDRLIAVSPEVRDEGLELGIGHPSRYAVIPEGVDFAPLTRDFGTARRTARRALGMPDDGEIIGWVGRFAPQKDPHTSAVAIVKTLEERPKAQAVLIGDGPLRREVQENIERSSVSERVHVIGLRPDARRLMPAFDVLLHLSRWEGQPRVVQEALAERIPVVATRTAGVPDLVRAGRTGAVVDIGDARGAAAAALSILRDGHGGPAAPLPEAELGALRAANGIETVLRRHSELYAELIEGVH